ncbi:hypothetical protein KIN20_037322 [Parelaphostrongylus tenuis]|uniref:UBX domain-containing protein n=1 Tax=Parelaphostrongylus tenuis TaxID=148309 RepID=A0AAD5REI8_PARTN|nr:hypothetical protein KIN20_037322 [Parelaphostrongylus tenuis]
MDRESFRREFCDLMTRLHTSKYSVRNRHRDLSHPDETSSATLPVSRKRKGSKIEVSVPRRKEVPKGAGHISYENKARSIVNGKDWESLVVPHCEPCTIRFRFPINNGGDVETAVFSMKTELSVVFVFISTRGLSPYQHTINVSFPRREYTLEHAAMTLEDLGFAKCEVVDVHDVGFLEE